MYKTFSACVVLAVVLGGAHKGRTARSPGSRYHGVLTFATPGNGDPFSPTIIQDYDIATGGLAVRFDGIDASQAKTGEVAYITRLAGGWMADHGVVVADARGVPGAPVFVCKQFNWIDNQSCHTPKLSPDHQRVAYVSRGGWGKVCKSNYDMYWSDFVDVTDRRGTLLARFEGYYAPEWLPDGRLLMMGSQCRNAGIHVADQGLKGLSRIDDDQVVTPAGGPAVSPDGRTLAFIWNNQVWSLPLTGKPELTKMTGFGKPVSAATWSPDGRSIAALMFDVSMPVRSIALFQPGDQSSVEFRNVAAYPYGPISWR